MKNLANNVKSNLPSLLLIAIVFVVSSIFSLAIKVPISTITKDFNYSVIIILIVMELFTNLIVETGIMQFLATRLAVLSKGNKRLCMILFGTMMFFISAFLNNITAVMIVIPVIVVLLKALNADAKYIYVFFAAILALSNTGGAASPIGDFPAIVIMTSGITTFTGYLFRAFPLFLVTSIAILACWCLFVRDKETSKSTKMLAVDLLHSQYKHLKVRYDVLISLGVVMICMFIAWSVVPQSVVPPEIVAVLGYCVAMIIASAKGIHVKQGMDMKSVLTISSFLFMATIVSASGILTTLAAYLQSIIPDPKMLLIVVMVITSLVAGLFSAGPAAAAMLPVIVNLCSTSLSDCSNWVAIAYAASICAGSSLFLWSATAGFILSGKIDSSNLKHEGKKVNWGIKQYFKFGFANYAIQMIIAIAWICLVIK